MNNILTYEKYRRLVKLSESLYYNEENNTINEGIVDKIKEHISTKHVDKVLAEEIELGKQVEERIKSTMEELSEICNNLKVKNESGSEFKKSLNKIIEDINKTSFDTLSLLGDSEIDFSGFKRDAVMSNVINISVLFSPIKNAIMLRKAYLYFIGLVKYSLRRDLVILLINFDQFQNMILQKSLESEENARVSREINQAYGKIEGMYQQVLAEAVGKKSNKFMDKLKKAMEIKKQEIDMMDKHNPMAQFFMNSYDNTYKQTADTLKQLIGEDDQKYLESYKNTIQKIGSTDKDGKLGAYGDLLILSAEERALKTSVSIHTNFLKIAEVFKLSNQKKLVEMMQDAEKEHQEEIEKLDNERRKKESNEFDSKVIDFINKEGENILKSVKTFDDYDKLHGDIDGPNNTKFSKKDILLRYLIANKSNIDKNLKVIVPYNKFESDYNNCYLSYIDVIVDKVRNMVDTEKSNHKLSFNKLDDKEGENEIKNKFFNVTGKKHKLHDVKDEAKNALKIISDEIVKFDYKLLLEKLSDAVKNYSVTINKNALNELLHAIEYMKKYKDNDYSPVVDKKEKSED